MAWQHTAVSGLKQNLDRADGSLCMWDLIDLLTNNVGAKQWVMFESWDGVSAPYTPVTHGGTGAGGLGNTDAYVWLQDPDFATSGREIIIQCKSNAAPHVSWVALHNNGLFAPWVTNGGNALPAAVTGEVSLCLGKGTTTPRNAATMFPNPCNAWWHCACQDAPDGDVYAFWAGMALKTTGALETIFDFDCVADAESPATDADKSAVLFSDDTNFAMTYQGFFSEYQPTVLGADRFQGWQKAGDAAREWGQLTPTAVGVFSAASNLVLVIPGFALYGNYVATNPNATPQPWCGLPVFVYRDAAYTAPGWKGVLKYTRLNPNLTLNVYPDVLDFGDTDHRYLVWGTLLLPGWYSDSVPPNV